MATDPRVCVLAVTSMLTVTVEDGPAGAEGDEVHVHPGGQGLWVARMAASLGADVVVCGPFGGEVGGVVRHLAGAEGFEVRSTPYGGSNGAYVHDRRQGERAEVARMDPTPLGRHEVDELFGATLTAGLDADVTAVTGAEPAEVAPVDLFGRLVTDLRASGRTVVADVSGDLARAVVEGGVDVLKISHEEMVEGRFARSDGVRALVTGARALREAGAGAVVVSRADEPTLVVADGDPVLVESPPVTIVEHRGAGDSMTAGICVGLGRGLDLHEAVALGAAAGALNVTRRGLGSGDRDQVGRLAREVVVRGWEDM